MVREAHIDTHPESCGDRRERRLDLITCQPEAIELELDALKEHRLAAGDIEVLIGVDDVPIVLHDEVGDGRHQPVLVGAREQHHCGRVGAQPCQKWYGAPDQSGGRFSRNASLPSAASAVP